MVCTYKEIKKKLGSNYQIKKKLENKELFKIEDGIYSNKEIVDPMVLANKKYPKSVITMDSAFYYYDLTDVIPRKTHISTKNHSYVISDDDIIQTFMSDYLFDIGVTQVFIDDDSINIYDKERLLIEIVRRRNQIAFDYYKEIINNYRAISHELKIPKLEKYLSNFSNNDKIFNIIQMEVF